MRTLSDMGRRWRRALPLVVLLAAAGIVVPVFMERQGQEQAPGQRPSRRRDVGNDPVAVLATTARLADVPVYIEGVGTARPANTVVVRPQVDGQLTRIAFTEGQDVRKGDLLATIDPRQFEMALQQATGQRMRDEAQLDAARVTLQRFRTLLAQDSIARQEVDTQAALVKQLEAAVVISKANEGAARLNLGYTRIHAPIGGRVGLRTVDVGNVVSPGDANGVALITQLAPIDVEFAIPQDQAAALAREIGRSTMQARALDRTRSTVLETGTFASLDNQVDTQTGTVRAKARFDNDRQQLFPSQFVNLQLRLRTIEGAVTVPLAAVRTGANGDYVFVLQDDRTVQLRNVQRGQATADRVQIVQGLQAGERVVTEGADRLRDGSRVMLPAPGGAAPNDGEQPHGQQGARVRQQPRQLPQSQSQSQSQMRPPSQQQPPPQQPPQSQPRQAPAQQPPAGSAR